MSVVSSSKPSLISRPMSVLVRRASLGLTILLAIAYLTLFGLIVGERGRAGLPVRPAEAGLEALRRGLDYLVNHPGTYTWHRQDVPALQLVSTLFVRSAALLLLSLGIAALVGVPLGVAIALLRRVRAAPLVLLLSVLGVSTPSFLLAMLFWVVNAQLYRWLGLRHTLLPPIGFGWDAHLVMPALVLATRPLAQVVQITYVSLLNVMGEDYIQTARAKGLSPRMVITRHAMRNSLIPVLTTLGTSLRFSLASLPVVEAFFNWPGVGLALLQAIESGLSPLVTDLIASLGFLFLLVNQGLELIYQAIDPRLAAQTQSEIQVDEPQSWQECWNDVRERFSDTVWAAVAWAAGLKNRLFMLVRFRSTPSSVDRLRPLRPFLADLPGRSSHSKARLASEPGRQPWGSSGALSLPPANRSAWWLVRISAGNFPLLIGALLVLGLVGLAVGGDHLVTASPYETHGVMTIQGKIGAPPFAPSVVFPWGSDAVGRDIQALVLAGARQTLTLAFLSMLARLFLGATLGILTGWWRHSWLDRLVSAAVAVWAAFPVTLFAMILILALGIKQGMGVFVVALCVVGWGEIAQFIRGQVIGLKPQLYIQAAQAVGARTGRILIRHILPHLWGPLVVWAVLEMGSVLMLLAELGFLNVFLGGGFKAEIADAGRMVPIVYYFSDVPEWGALLANIRDWWRSYPWLAWYPGLAFFVAILAFNLWGEGLRRFLEDSRFNIGRLINRYSLVMVTGLVVGGAWLVRSTTPMEMYGGQAKQFDVERALRDVRELSSPAYQGRESGTPGAGRAAEYIAAQMEEIGLLPAGGQTGYIHSMLATQVHLTGAPRLELLPAPAGQPLVYRQDFVEYTSCIAPTGIGEREGPVVGLALGPYSDEAARDKAYDLTQLDLRNKVVLVRQSDLERIEPVLMTERGRQLVVNRLSGMLVVNDDPALFERKYLFTSTQLRRSSGNLYYSYYFMPVPALSITSATADRLLAAAGGLAQLDALSEGLQPGQAALTDAGALVRLALPTAPEALDEAYQHVIGFIPGSGSLMGEKEKGQTFGKNVVKGLDSSVIIISAYYDGLGIGPDGVLYPGANDNASGVAAMLEIARAIKQGPAQPRKTLVFVAWSGGERQESFSVANAMSARRGFNMLTVEAVLELSGLGAGSGQGLSLGQATSFSMVKLFQEAAGKIGLPVSTRGRDPHFGLEAMSSFGGRTALSAYVSWDGSDQMAHTPADTFEVIDPDKLEKAGQVTLLVVSVLGQAQAQASPRGVLMPSTHYLDEARQFDEAQALEHIRYLADDVLEGRRTGTAGGLAAGEYIAARFAEYGLQPGGLDGGYFQPFSVPYTMVIEAPLLNVARPALAGAPAFSRTYVDHFDYWPRITNYLGTGRASGQAVWLNECRASDFDKLDNLVGKIALCYESNLTSYKQMIEQALEHGVGGILLTVEGEGPFPRSAYASTRTMPLPAFYVTDLVAQDLLGGGAYTLDDFKRQATVRPLSATIQMGMMLEAHLVDGRNVLGLLPGSDPGLKDEIVIVGAHYDHLGRDPDGTIYNGANVNASGVGVMLEIARLWQAQGYRPARSMLFVAWDDETQGWWGSNHYVQQPVYPLDQTVANLNLEMVGRGKDVTLVGQGAMADQIEASARAYSASLEFVSALTWGDALPFFKAGIPSAMLMSVEDPLQDPTYQRFLGRSTQSVVGLGIEDPLHGSTYHRPEDDTDTIYKGHLRTAGVLAAHTLAAWSGGGPTQALPYAGSKRSLRDLILPTPTCSPPWPVGAMTCDHGLWSR